MRITKALSFGEGLGEALVNEEKPAGAYQAIFDAAGLASGIYFYRLQVGNFIQSKKMILVQ
jgi:hypothetical protein